jgi:glycerate-2-kinase
VLVARALGARGVSQATVIAAGKASAGMTLAAIGALGSAVRGGLVIAPERVAHLPRSFDCIVGGHPLPTEGSEDGGRKALALAESLTADDTLLVLLSGGASALMAVPADGISLDDKRATGDRLMREGADIQALNTVRKHLSQIKGGWLAARTRATTIALAISDVVGDDPSIIASGPTVADASTFAEALGFLQRYGGEGSYPAAVVALLKGASRRLKPGDAPRAARPVIGSRRDAMRGAAVQARQLDYEVLSIDDAIVGESRDAAQVFVRNAIERSASMTRPVAIIASGETTVHVKGRGKGGRNQEFSLAAVCRAATQSVRAELAPPVSDPFALASVGTDGVDGPTDAAGAIVDSTTLERARARGLDPTHFLDDNNA